MAGKIFINYRRGDDPGNTGRLFDRLQDVFKPEQLFIDVDNIAPGLDFIHVLSERVAECDVLLAVIGKGWIDARDPTGARRLDDPDDFVRIEISSALNQDKRVIPVLVGDAQMPRPDELPDAIKPLARRNAVRLTHERFRADVQGLIKALQQTLAEFDGLHQAELDTSRRAQAEEQRKRAEQTASERAIAHQAAVASGNPAALRAFLDAYPTGPDATQIRRRLRRLESPAAWNPRPAIIAAGALAVVLVAGTIVLRVKATRTPPTAAQTAAETPRGPASADVPPPVAKPAPVAKPKAVAVAVPQPAPAVQPLPVPQSAPAPQPASPPQPPSATAAAPPPVRSRSPDAIAWSLLKGTSDEDSLKRFVAQYPDSPLRKDAETQIAALAQQEAARIAAANQIEMTRSLQFELKRVGCYEGDANGQLDDATKAAWHSFTKLTSITMPDEVSPDAVKAVRAIDKRVCPLLCPTGQHAEADSCVADAPPPKHVTTEVDHSRQLQAAKPRPAAPKAHARCFSYGGSQFCE